MSSLELANEKLQSRISSLDITDEAWGATDLMTLLPSDEPSFVWLHAEHELVGWGEAARLEVSGPERFSRAQRWLRDFANELSLESEQLRHLIAFASFAFDPDQQTSVVVVPKVTISRRNGECHLTLLDDGVSRFGSAEQRSVHLAATQVADEARAEGANVEALQVVWQPDLESKVSWSKKVTEAVTHIDAGELEKVVLARASEAHANQDIDPRWCLRELRESYPTCWVFKVDNLVGATPELLVARHGTAVSSRVLAGTIHPQNHRSAGEEKLAARLLESAKDLTEHKYAVTSVATALAKHCTDLQVPKRPSVLALGNVSHLATEISGELADDASALILSASLHPTAAVCGTPTERALALINEIEDLERGRYAGPIGWVSLNGDGEFGIALRCAEIDGDQITAFAGCGLVAGSEPEQEWQESEAKLGAIKGVFAS
jgi:menaquinone-specific isochorismate synthase